jgi:hypothetical protein
LHASLHAEADAIDEAGLRAQFLSGVPEHRFIEAAWKETAAGR